ncbi:uncharacterized protein [Atheta coriaria]|uniref:uncharacterized protein n=1 Tax=Dalotia coriaria TaxID=877792 RepID=UPI0031F35911
MRYNRLQELHIETGKLGPNEIAAWYDTFDTQTLEFLDWFQDNISSDNCLEYSETLAYDELINKELFLEGTAYDQALEQCESDHPGIFNQEANELECELLEAELSYHQEELEYLTKSLCITNDKNKDLKKKHSGQMLEISNVDLHKDKAASTCLQLACVLDQLNTNLGEKLLACFNIINNTHDYDTTTLSTTFNHEGNNEFVPQLELILTEVLASLDISNNSLNISKSVNRSVQSHEESLISSVFVDMEKSLYNNPEYITTFRVIADRLTHVLYQYHESAGKVEVLNAKMKQLQNLSRFGLGYDSIRYNTPSKLRNIRQKPPNIQQFVKYLINQPNMSLKSTEEAGINAKIKCFIDLESKLDDLLQFQHLTLELFACEVETFDQLDHFVLEIKEYVLKELKHCETRMEDMQLIVDDYKLYQQKPIEEKWHTLGLILKLIEAETDIDLTEALLVIRAFEDKCVDIKGRCSL